MTEVSTGATNDNDSAVIDKVKDEDKELTRAELLENEKNTSTLLKEDVQTQKPVESLHVVPENSKASNLGQDNETTNVNPHESTNDVTEEKTIDAVETQKEVHESVSTNVSEEGSTNTVVQGAKSDSTNERTIDEADIQNEVLENFSTIGSNEETEEKSMIKVDGSETKIEEVLEKENTKTSSLQPLDEEPRKDEPCEIEKCTESMLLDIEPKIGNPEDSLNVASEDIKTSDSGHEIETSSFGEQIAIAHPQDGKTEDRALDAAEIKEEILEVQNVSTIVPNEKTEENSLIQVDGPQKKNEEHLEKDSEIPSLTKDLGQEIETSSFEEQSATAHSQIILDQKTEEEALDATETKEETLEVQNVPTIVSNEKTEDNSSIQVDGPEKENEEHLEKINEKPSLIKDFTGNANDDKLNVMDEVKLGDENPSNAEVFEKEKNRESGLPDEEVHMENPVQSFLTVREDKESDFHEDQGVTENPQGILGEKTEEETTDAVDTKKKTQEQQNVAINVSNEDNDKDSAIQLDASQMEHDAYLGKEIEKPSLIEASTEDTNDDKSTITHEVGLFDSDKDIDTALLKKENFQEAPEDHKPAASSDNIETTCSLDEQTSTTNPQSIMSDKAIDSADTKEVNLENVATNIPHEHTEENIAIQVDCSQKEHDEHLRKESENSSLTEDSMEETTDKDEDLIKAEMQENARSSISTSVNEEAQVECALEGEAQGEKHNDSSQAATDDIKESDSTQDTKMSSSEEEIQTANPREISNDKTEETTDDAADTKALDLQDIATNIPDGNNEINALIEEDGSQKPSLKEVSIGKTEDNVSAVGDECLTRADLLENEKNEGTLVKEEVPSESLQVATEDIKASALVQDREISSLEDQSLTANPQGILGDNKEDKNDATDSKEETHEDKDVATTTHEVTEENSPVPVDGSQLEHNENLDKESENTSVTEAPRGDTTENTFAKEEVEMEKPIDYLQVGTEDIKASASSQDKETSSIEEQIPIADPQEIASDKIEEKTIVAGYTKEKALEDVATNVPNSANEDNLPIEVDGSQKPFSEEVSMGNANDDESRNIHEVKFVDDNLKKASLFEDEKNTECTPIEKEVVIESVQEADGDIKACDSCQNRETTSLEEQEDKTSDEPTLEEETPEDKNAVTTIPHEATEEISLSQVDSSKMEQKEHLEKKSENASLAEEPTGDTIESSSKEEAWVEKSGDIKASASGQDTEINSKEDRTPPADPQEISCDKTEEKTTDASYTHEELIEDIVANVPNGDNEDNSQMEVYGLQEPSLKEASTGNNNDVESTFMREAKFEDANLIKDGLVDNEKYTEGDLVNEKVSIDSLLVGAEEIKASASSQERETSSLEVQTLATTSQEIMINHKEDKTIDATGLEEETLLDKSIARSIPYEDAEKNSLVQVDCSQIEYNEHLEKESEIPSLTEARTGDTTESALSKEEPEIEKLVGSFQVPIENNKASISSQDTEQILTVDPQEISHDKTKEIIVDATDRKEETLEVQDIAVTVPSGDNEDNSPTKVDGSQNPSLTEASTGNATEVQDIAINVPTGDNEDNSPTNVGGLQKPSFTEASTGNTADHESTVMYENEKNTEGTLIKEEISTESLQVAAGDIKASDSGQDRETGSLEEQRVIANPQEEVMGDNEDKKIDATDLEEETSKDIVTNVPDGNDKDKSPMEAYDLQEPSLIEASTGNNNDVESTIMHEAKFEDENLIKADLVDNKKYTGDDLVNEKVSTDSLLVGAEEIKASASSQERETSSLEVQTLATNSQEIMSDHKEHKIIDATELEEETPQDKNIAATIPFEDAENNSLIQADCSKNGSNEHLEKESENSSLTEAQTGDNKESVLLKEESEMEKHTDSFHVATEDIEASTSSQDTEKSFIDEQILTVVPQETSGDKTKEEIVDVTDTEEKTLEFQDIAINVPSGDKEDNTPTKVDCSRNPSLPDTLMGTATATEVQDIATNIPSDDNEDNLPTKVDGQDRETSTQEEQSLIVNPQEIIDATDLKEETSDYKEKGSESVAVKIPSAKDLDVNTDTVMDIAEDPNCKHEESSITNASEDHTMISNEHIANVTSLASEPSEQDSDHHKVVGEANSCGDKADTENISLLNDDSTKIPTNENLVETDPKESTKEDAQVPNEEEKAEFMQQDMDAGTDQKNIEEELLITSSQDVPDSNGLNGEEERTNSNDHKDISDSSNSVALEEVSPSNVASEKDSIAIPSQESRRETQLESENEEAQKQDEDLHVSALVQDSSMEKIEKEVQLCPASAKDSEITQDMQQLEEASVPAPDDNTIENTECKESEVVEDATKNENIEHLEREQEETECKQEKVLLDETVEEIKESTSIPVANDFLPKSFTETSEVHQSTAERQLTINTEELQTGKAPVSEDEEINKDKEEEAGEQKISDFNSAVSNIIEASDKDVGQLSPEAPEESTVINNNTSVDDILVNNKSIADLEAKIDDEAPEIIETAPTATEGREVDSTSVGETSVLIAQCEKDDYEHAYIGTEKKSDSNEVEFAPEDSKSGYEAKNQVLESIGQVQSCSIISKAEENLEAAAEIKSETVMVEDTFEPKENTKVNISSEKIKEEDDVEDYHIGSCKEEAITESHLEDQVSKVSEEADDKAVKEPEEKLQVNESIDSSLNQEERGKSVTTILDTEEVHESAHSNINAETQDSREEVNSSAVAILEDEDKSTRADDVDNEMAKDEELINQNSNTSAKDAASEEQPKREDEHLMCEAPPTKTVYTTIEDTEGEKENANAIMMQHQEDDNKSKHESGSLPEFIQGKESEKQDQKDEIRSSDEVQIKDEVNLMLSAGKGEEESQEADTCSKPTEDEDKNTYDEADKVDISSHTEDTTEVSHSDVAQDVPEDNENSTTKNKYSEEKCPNENTESQISIVNEDMQELNEGSIEVSNKEKQMETYVNENLETSVSSEGQEAEAIQKAPLSETLKLEIEEQQLGKTSEAVSRAIEVNFQEEKIRDDDCNDLIENSSSAQSEKISESIAHLSSMEDTPQSSKNQETQRQIDSLPVLPAVKCSDIEIAEKDLPMQSTGLDGTGVTELKVTPIASNDKHVVLEADHTSYMNPENSIGNKKISAECSQGEHELLKETVPEPEEATCENEEKTSTETTKSTEMSESKEIDKPSLSDLLQVSPKETSQMASHSANEKEPTIHSEDLQAEKTDEEKDDEDESSERKKSELSSEAPVMVEMGDADVKVAHKKSHNILSGVGSKVKHSIAKVKKVITGKSSHPKPPSPK
ncbi:hypothetical protein DH2020_009468 [Rehmannia glutinosa]|uniref:Titin-like n=1 Tax=Rehmannia glutinosa TaxID=99300 RepID=A0ABR0X9J7_REHGL